MFWLGLTIGLFCGGSIGAVLMGVVTMSKERRIIREGN
jgi:hypothetical protein